ncbi:hypothetical protein BH10ACT8_BH10ACT8_16220 [soil metagenome]
MSLFARRSKPDLAPAVAGLVLDRTWRDDALDRALDAVAAGQLTAGLALLSQTRHDPELRSQYLQAIGTACIGRAVEIEALCAEHPTDPDVMLLLGRTRLDEAWATRGGGWAEQVGPDRFASFHAGLDSAKEGLLSAAELAPHDPVPWEQLQWFALGAELGIEDQHTIWSNVSELAPTLYPAHRARLQLLSEKWAGSHEEMFEFARASVTAAPSGDPLVSMLPLAHFEYLLRVRYHAQKKGSPKDFLRVQATYFSGEVLAEVLVAEAKWLDGRRPHPRDLEAHHLFGGAFALAPGQSDRARWHLSQVGNRVHDLPWGYFSGTAAQGFGEAAQRLSIALPAT